ncbi:hypothetical protein Tco_1100973 [Tanacetum coccineum]
MGRLSVSDRKQGVQKEQVPVLPKIHQGHHQPLYVTRSVDSEKEQGKRLKVAAKGVKSGMKRQPARGLETLSEVALTKAEQLRIVSKQSLIQTHSSHASGSGAHEGTGATPGVPDVLTYKSDDEEIYWKISLDYDDDNEGDDDVANDDHDDVDNQKEKEEESSFPRVHTPSQYEPSDNEASVDVAQSEYTKEEEVNVEHTYEEEDANDLYKDLNVNLEGVDVDMTDAPQTTQVIEDTYVTLTPVNPEGHQQSSSVSSGFISNMLNPNLDTGIDSILNTESTSLVEIPTNQYATALSSIPNISDNYLGSKLKEVVDVVVQLKSDRIREEAQAENEDFFNKLVNEQLEFEVLIRSSNEAKTSHVVAANLSEMELKKILIDKMKSNKSIDRSDEQKNLYKALVNAYEADKALLDAYGDTVTIKRRWDNANDDQEPSIGPEQGTTGKSTEGSKSHQQSAGQSALAEVPMHTTDDFEDPTHQEFDTGLNNDQLEEEAHPHLDWFQQPSRLPSLDQDWNKTVPTDHGPVQPWLSNLARIKDPRESFDELMDTPLDFSAFMMNRPKVDTLTPELLAGQRYPHDLRKPLPLIPNSRGRQVIPFAHFINNDLAYLSGGVSSQTYSTSVTKTKAADYGNIKCIEDLVPSSIWSEVPVSYGKYALWGISHWGYKRQQFYGFTANRESTKDVYSRRRIIAVTKLQIVEWHGYKHLDWITIRRADDKLYSFKEGDFKRLCLQDMLILLVQGKLTNLKVEECLTFSVALRMFTRSIFIQRRVEDLQLGVESYQKKLNITKPDTYIPDLRRQEAYTAYPNPRGFIYQNRDKKNKLMRLDELYKFCDGTLNDVRTALDDRLKGIQMEYLPQTIWRNSDKERAAAMIHIIDKILKSRRIMRSLERFVGGRPCGGDLRLLQRTI